MKKILFIALKERIMVRIIFFEVNFLHSAFRKSFLRMTSRREIILAFMVPQIVWSTLPAFNGVIKGIYIDTFTGNFSWVTRITFLWVNLKIKLFILPIIIGLTSNLFGIIDYFYFVLLTSGRITRTRHWYNLIGFTPRFMA